MPMIPVDEPQNMQQPQRTQSFTELNKISRAVLDGAFRVHSALGPGLLESAYEHCLLHELTRRGVNTRRQVDLPIEYEGIRVDAGYRLDLLVEETVIVEIKAVDALLPIHEAQLLTYLKLSRKPLGLLINFNTRSLKNGIKRMVHTP